MYQLRQSRTKFEVIIVNVRVFFLWKIFASLFGSRTFFQFHLSSDFLTLHFLIVLSVQIVGIQK